MEETEFLAGNTPMSRKKQSSYESNTYSINGDNVVRFEVFTAVTMKNAVFWDVAPCSSCMNRGFGGT
jgi:hypothetical protein